jgi:uncharacterized protein (DUF1778 family)
MAKKSQAGDTPQKKKIVKLFVTAEQAHLLRVAAALHDQSMGDYARDVVLDAAAKATAGMPIGANAETKAKKHGS